ncbi:MAG: 4'-phosphopantetheinyl transferase superfamily protein [Spirochaetaceae bacterium]|jgi:4'-phosphopantetheinyl transferase|nr:4'-phosphopantetheinyl transferase superfamily protein [Spirochaetaceae bacterium]
MNLIWMIDILFVDVRDLTESAFPEYLDCLTQTELQRTMTYRFFTAQKLTAFGILLIKHYFFQKYGMTNLVIMFKENGKPYIPGNISFSISHSQNITCAAFCEKEIGVDIEFRRTVSFKEISRRFNTEEQVFIENSLNTEKAFFYIWTRKEALLKAMGIGFAQNLLKYNCVKPKITNITDAIESAWYLQSFNLRDNFTGAVCIKNAMDEYTITELMFPNLLRKVCADV